MRLKLTTLILFILSLFILPSAQARLHLELTQGVNITLPIAITPFKGDVPVAGGQPLTTVISNDLSNSGQFRIQTSTLPAPADLAHFDGAQWQQQGIDYVVTGSVKSTGGEYQVAVQLYSVFGPTGNQAPRLLFNRQFTAPQQNLRQLAHHISDTIYQQLTGVRGIFSTKIAYVLVQRPPHGMPSYTLEVADADGFNPQRLLVSPQPIMSPTWSPNGRSLAYVSYEGHRASIYIQDIRTGQRSVLSHFPGINGAPAFSPDGTQIALVLTRTSNPKIFLMNLQSKQLEQITEGFSIDTEPVWSADGRFLLFTSDRGGGKPQIYRYELASRQISRLTFQGDYNARASLSPDNKVMVMMNRDSGSFGIARQDLSSGKVQVLVRTGKDESPSLAPNGRMVLYATTAGRRGVLSVVSIDGRIKLRLPAPSGNVQEPAWSPFLSKI